MPGLAQQVDDRSNVLVIRTWVTCAQYHDSPTILGSDCSLYSAPHAENACVLLCFDIAIHQTLSLWLIQLARLHERVFHASTHKTRHNLSEFGPVQFRLIVLNVAVAARSGSVDYTSALWKRAWWHKRHAGVPCRMASQVRLAAGAASKTRCRPVYCKKLSGSRTNRTRSLQEACRWHRATFAACNTICSAQLDLSSSIHSQSGSDSGKAAAYCSRSNSKQLC